MPKQTTSVQCHTKLAFPSDLFMKVFPFSPPRTQGNIFSLCAETKNKILSLGQLVKRVSSNLSAIPLLLLESRMAPAERMEAANHAFKIQRTQQEALTEDML